MERNLLLLFFLLSLLLIPLASAESVYYYPSLNEVNSIFSSNLTYQVVSGNETWAKEWGMVIDETLRATLRRGKNPNCIILVGNLKNNAYMRKVWSQTHLPANYSYQPGIIVLDNGRLVLFVGSSRNFYKTMSVFNSFQMPLSYQIFLYFLIVIFGILFLLELKKWNRGTTYSYSLVFLLYLVWLSNLSTSQVSSSFYRVLGQTMSKIPHIFNLLDKYFPISVFTIEITSLLVLFFLMSLSFYIVPPHARDVGFIVFGLMFSSPIIREYAHVVRLNVFGLLTLALFLTILSNVDFPKRRRFLRAFTFFILAVLTVIMYILNPFLILTALAMILSYPNRRTEIIVYLAFVLIILSRLGFSNLSVSEFHLEPAVEFLWNSLLSLLLFLYSYFKLIKEDINFPIGQDRVVLLSFVFLLPGLVFSSLDLLPYEILLVSSLAIRAVTMLRDEELEKTKKS